MNLPRIAIHYRSLENIGGIERVVTELARIFSTHSSYVTIITEEPIRFFKDYVRCDNIVICGEDRKSLLARLIEERRIEWVIFNDPSHEDLEEDIATVHKYNCKAALMIHFSFPSPIYFTEAAGLFDRVVSVGKNADAIACVSSMDAVCWRALGLNTFHVQNPFVHSDIDDIDNVYACTDAEPTVIWVGRGASQKQPFVAIDIMTLVCKAVPEAKLLMIGVGKLKGKLLNYASKSGIKNNIEIVEQTNDVGAYYKRANVHLLTSLTESFCLVIAEAKQYGLPTVMFDIPFLELVESRKGVCLHEMGENAAMACSIVKLLTDQTFYKSMSAEALASLVGFNDTNVAKSWSNLFHNEYTTHEADVSIGLSETIKAWKTFVTENRWKIEICETIDRVSPISLQHITQRILRVVQRIKNIKHKIR